MSGNEDKWDMLVVVQLLRNFWLFAVPWTAACQASLSFTMSWYLLKLKSIESVMPSNHLIPFSFCLQSFHSWGSFPKSWFFVTGSQSIGASASVLPMNIQGWFPLGLTGSKSMLLRSLQHHSSKASILWCSAFFNVWISHLYMTTGKIIALTMQTFVGKVMSLLFKMSAGAHGHHAGECY